MDKLRIGVIGLGWFGEIQCEAIVGIPNLELAALCTRTPERLKAMATKFGVAKAMHDYRDVLADPHIDAVSIVTMWDQHTEPAIDALAAGKHVFLEKPIASTVEDASKISAASSIPTLDRPCIVSLAARQRRSRRSGACPRRPRSTSTNECRSSATLGS